MSENESTQSLDTKFKHFEEPSDDPVSPALQPQGCGSNPGHRGKHVTRRIPWLPEGQLHEIHVALPIQGQACGRFEKCQWYLDRLIASLEQV